MSIVAKVIAGLLAAAGTAYGGHKVYQMIQSGDWSGELEKMGINSKDLKNLCEAGLKIVNPKTSDQDTTKICSGKTPDQIKKWLATHGKDISNLIVNWTNSADDVYKGIFTIFKSEDEQENSEFMKWLNEGVTDGQLTKESSIEDGAKRLKGKCEKMLDGYQDKTNEIESHWKGLTSWCIKRYPGDNNDNLNQLLEKMTNRKRLSNLDNLYETWKNVSQITEVIKKEESSKNKETLTNEDYKNFCEKYTKNEAIVAWSSSTNNDYSEKYVTVGSICYQATSQ